MRQKENNGKTSRKDHAKVPATGGLTADRSLSRLAPLGAAPTAASTAADKIGKPAAKGGGKTKAKR